MPTFDFICNPQDEYPASSTQVSYGKGYQFASAPMGPDQITVRLSFPKGLFWFEDRTTRIMNTTVNPRLNIGALKTFYESVRMYVPFDYNHPHRGVQNFRFAKPLIIPKTVDDIAPGGYGNYNTHQTEPFELQLIMLP